MLTVLNRHQIREREESELKGMRLKYEMIGYVMCEECKGTGIKSRSFKSIVECEHCDGEGGFKAEKSLLDEMQQTAIDGFDGVYSNNDKEIVLCGKDDPTCKAVASDLIIKLVEEYYGSGKAMQVADILRGE